MKENQVQGNILISLCLLLEFFQNNSEDKELGLNPIKIV